MAGSVLGTDAVVGLGDVVAAEGLPTPGELVRAEVAHPEASAATATVTPTRHWWTRGRAGVGMPPHF